MAQKLEEIRGGGGSIRVGSQGTISSLMNRELEFSSSSSSRNPRSAFVAIDSTLKPRKSMDEGQSSMNPRSPVQHGVSVMSSTTPKRQKQKATLEEASCSRDGNVETSPEFPWVQKRTQRIPMLDSENVALDKTPKREKPARKVSIVEVVDTKCGVPAGSLSNRLKKLGFSKLSQSII